MEVIQMHLFNRYKRDKILTWKQYSTLIKNIDHIRFMDQTARESVRNYWKNRERTGFI